MNSQETIYLGLAVSVLTIVLRWIYQAATSKKLVVPNWVMVVIVYLVSFVLALIFTPSQLGALPVWAGDPSVFVPALLTFVGTLLTYLTAVTTLATIFYTFVLQKLQAVIPQLGSSSPAATTPAKK